MPSLVNKINPKEHAIEYGHEVMSHCSRWKELSIYFQTDASQLILLSIVPEAGRREILNQL